MDRRAAKHVFLICLFLFSFPLARELETCYRVYYVFFPVAENCMKYKIQDKELIVEASAKTVVIGKLVKPIHNWGVAVSNASTLKTKEFLFYQREGNFKRDHVYKFYDGLVKVKITKYRKNSDKIERVLEKIVSVGDYVDPFTASIAIYKHIPYKKEGRIKVFYDGKRQSIDYRLVGEERVKTDLGKFNTWKVELFPNISTRGLLRPKGRWFIWIDKKRKIPVKLKISFVIGTAVGLIYKLKGYEQLFSEDLIDFDKGLKKGGL